MKSRIQRQQKNFFKFGPKNPKEWEHCDKNIHLFYFIFAIG
jgi:hypothetical protein